MITRLNESRDERIPLVDILCLAGVNHRTAPVSMREKFAICESMASEVMKKLRREFHLDEIVALSTCNRTELYWTSPEPVEALDLFRSILGVDSDSIKELGSSIYVCKGRDVATHLFRVACGMDSMVLGETQIASQVKRAYENSRESGLTDHALNVVFQKAFEVTKRVYAQTSLASRRTSVPSVALEFSEAIFEDVSEMFVVVIGTGEMARLTFEVLRERGVRNVAFVTGTAERARVWESMHEGAEITLMENIPEFLKKADIVVACTTTDKPVISADDIREALAAGTKPNRPLLILDLGIPRNIDPDAGRLEQVYLHNIDDLEELVEKNRERLKGDVEKGDRIIERSLEVYLDECRSATTAETIRDIRSLFQGIAGRELERTMRKISHLSDRDKDEVATAVHRILAKILHPPSENLRIAARNGRGDEAVSWARKLFGLDPLFPSFDDTGDSLPEDEELPGPKKED